MSLIQMTCPNKNTEAWKELVKEYGEGKALTLFVKNNNEIPSLSEVSNLEKSSQLESDTDLNKKTTSFLESIGVSVKYVDSIIRNPKTKEIEKVLAPNGEESLLFRTINEFESDKEVALKLWAQVYTPSFKAWFGDWENGEGSKVVDANGEPLVVYHGTDRVFDFFDKQLRGDSTGKSINSDFKFDSENAFFFSENKNVSFYYAVLRRQEELSFLINYLEMFTSELSWDRNKRPEIYKTLREKSPKFAAYVDGLKQRGLTNPEIMQSIKELYKKYASLRDLTRGGAISNPSRFYNDAEKTVNKLIQNKSTILGGKYRSVSPYSEEHSITFANGDGISLHIGPDGLIYGSSGVPIISPFLQRNITQLSPAEFDKLIHVIQGFIIEGKERVQADIKRGGFTPILMPTFLNLQSPFIKDFEGAPFVQQMDGTGAVQEVSELVDRASKIKNVDGVIIQNIKDPELATNYAVFEPNQIKSVFNQGTFLKESDNIYYQTKNNNQLINKELNNKIIAFLEKIGVSVKILDSIKDALGNPLDVVAKADMLNKIIEIVHSRADLSTLPEEASHFFVELLGEEHPLYKQMFDTITSYEVYRDTVQNYLHLPAYKKADGTPNFDKIKKEAMGKLITAHILRLNNGDETAQNINRAQKWWLRVWDYIKKIFFGEPNPFEVSARSILTNDLPDFLNSEIVSAEEYYQVQDGLDKLLADQDRIKLDNTIDTRTGQKRHIYYVDGKATKGSVTTTKVDAYYKKIFPTDRRSDFQKELDLLKAEYGDVIHADIQEIFYTLVDPKTGVRRTDKLTPQSISTNKVIYNQLEQHMIKLMSLYSEDTKFFTEVKIYDPKADIAGSIDLLIVQPNGVADIFDWKSQEIKANQEDIKTFKEPAYRIQLGEYKHILEKYYGFTHFGKIRAIPIKTEFSYTGKLLEGNLKLESLKSLEIGDVNPENIPAEKNYLLPVILTEESTGDPHLDELIKKLNAILEIVQTKKVKADQKHIQRDEISRYRNAIRDLQVKKNVLRFISLGTHEINLVIKKLGSGTITKGELLDYQRIMDIYAQSAGYMETYFKELKESAKSEDENYNKLLNGVVDDFNSMQTRASIVVRRLETQLKKFAKEIGEENGIENLGTKEKSVGLWSPQGLFASLSTLPQRSVKAFYRMLRDGQNTRDINFKEFNNRATELKDKLVKWGQAKGLSGLDLFNGILEIDGNGKWNGSFLNKYKKEFYQKRDAAIKTNDIKWLVENTNFDKDRYKAAEKKMLEYYSSVQYDEDPQKNEEKQARNFNLWVNNNYHLDKDGKINPYAYLNPKNQFLTPDENWETEKWHDLNKPENAPLKDVYNFFQSVIRKSEQLGMLDDYSPHFIPSLFRSKVDQLAFGDWDGFFSGNGLLESLQVEGDHYFPEVDPLTGKLINRIPVYFTQDIGEATENGVDYSKKSRDLFKVFSIWAAHTYQYEALSGIEDDSRILVEAEKLKESFVTNKWGYVKRDAQGEVVGSKNNEENVQLLSTFVDFYLYNRRRGSDKDIKFKILGKEYSGVKSFRAVLNFFTMKTLALNLISGTAQFVGGTGNALLLGSKRLFFTNKDWSNAMFHVGKLDKKTKELIGFFNPLLEDQKHRLADALSVSGLVKNATMDNAFVIQRKADKAVQYPVAIAMTMNHMVYNGKVVDILDHVKEKYKYNTTFYNLPEKERKELYSKIETEVEALKATNSIFNTATVENGKLVIPGLKDSDKAALDFRSKIRKVNKTILGNSTQDDINSIRTTLFGQALMNFRSWMPQMFQERFQGLKKDEDLEKYLYGKTRLFFEELFGHFGTISKSFIQGLGSDGAVNRAKERYLEEKLKAYDEGREFDLTEGEFIDLYIGNMRSQLRELAVVITFAALVLSMASLDDDDDQLKGMMKYAQRALEKYKQEFSFYYSPIQFTDLVKSPLPIIGFLQDIQNFITNFLKEGWGLLPGNEEVKEKAHPMKYLFRIFPITKEAVTMGAIFDDDFRKEWGVKIN